MQPSCIPWGSMRKLNMTNLSYFTSKIFQVHKRWQVSCCQMSCSTISTGSTWDDPLGQGTHRPKRANPDTSAGRSPGADRHVACCQHYCACCSKRPSFVGDRWWVRAGRAGVVDQHFEANFNTTSNHSPSDDANPFVTKPRPISTKSLANAEAGNIPCDKASSPRRLNSPKHLSA